MLSARGLTFAWPGSANLLGPLDFDVSPSRIDCIIGVNGSGKSTFLSLLSGRIPPQCGDISLLGAPIKPLSISYVPQASERLLFPHLTLRENISVCRVGDAVITTTRRREIVSLLFSDEAASALDRLPARCSGGQRQRAVFARAMMEIPHFPMTFLDEPLSQISQDIKTAIYTQLRNLVRDSGSSVVLVSHDIDEAILVSDRLHVLTNGQFTGFDTSGITTHAEFDALTNLLPRVYSAMLHRSEEQWTL